MLSRKNVLKLILLALWLLLIGAYLYLSWANGWNHETWLTALVNLVDSPYGPLIYIVIFALHPLVFSSAVLLGIAGGLLFGAGATTNLIWAVVYAVIGSQSAAHVAYGIGRFLGDGLLPEGKQASVIQRYADRLRRHSFATIFIMPPASCASTGGPLPWLLCWARCPAQWPLSPLAHRST